MDKKTAQIIFVVFNLLAIPAVGYGIYDYVSVNSAIGHGDKIIAFDSGTYYLFLMSIFWIFSIIQVIGKRDTLKQVLKYANRFVVVWFVAMLLLANMLTYNLKEKFERAGYTMCDDPREISRIAKGESTIYTKKGCRD